MGWQGAIEQVTPEELAALADVLKASARQSGSAAEANPRADVVLRYDLLGAASAQQDAQPALVMAHERFGARVGSLLERITRVETSSFAHTIERPKFGQVLAQLPEPCSVMLVEFQGLGANGALIVEPHLLLHVMDLLAGGEGGADNDAVDALIDRGFTASEQRLAAQIARLVGKAFTEAFAEIAAVTLRPVKVETDARRARFLDPNEPVVKMPLQIDWADLSGNLSVILPWAALKPLEKQLARNLIDSPLSVESSWQDRLNSQLLQVELELVAELGCASLSLNQLLKLSEGDVLRLDKEPDGDVVVRVEGLPKLKAKAIISRGNHALRISEAPTERSLN